MYIVGALSISGGIQFLISSENKLNHVWILSKEHELILNNNFYMQGKHIESNTTALWEIGPVLTAALLLLAR